MRFKLRKAAFCCALLLLLSGAAYAVPIGEQPSGQEQAADTAFETASVQGQETAENAPRESLPPEAPEEGL